MAIGPNTTPKQILDKNGKLTTVHVRNDSASTKSRVSAVPAVQSSIAVPKDSFHYEYQGRVMGEAELRKKFGIKDGESIDSHVRDAAYEGNDAGKLPTRVRSENTLEFPEEQGDSVALNERELGLIEDYLTSVSANLVGDGSNRIGVTATFYENLLSTELFNEDELNAASPLVADFFRERFGAEIVGDTDGWDSVDLEFYAEFEPEDYTTMVVANTFGERSSFTKFIKESDAGTYGSPYAYNDLRKQMDAADFVDDRWTTLSDSRGIGEGTLSEALTGTRTPTDAEAIAIARSIAHDPAGSDVYKSELERFSERGWVKDSGALDDALADSVGKGGTPDHDRRAEVVIAWLRRNEES